MRTIAMRVIILPGARCESIAARWDGRMLTQDSWWKERVIACTGVAQYIQKLHTLLSLSWLVSSLWCQALDPHYHHQPTLPSLFIFCTLLLHQIYLKGISHTRKGVVATSLKRQKERKKERKTLGERDGGHWCQGMKVVRSWILQGGTQSHKQWSLFETCTMCVWVWVGGKAV